MNVYLCRYKGIAKPVGFPDNEGDPNHKNYFKTSMPLKGITYEIIDKTESSAGTADVTEGGFSFGRLVMPDLGALQEIIENHPYYQHLSEGLKKNLIRKGEWRLEKSWSDLAVAAGFNKTFFERQYRYLCGFAHSNRISVIQIQQVTDLHKQKQMLYGSMAIQMVVLAKHSYDYIQAMPELRVAIDTSSAAYQLVMQWKQIGENLAPNITEPPIS